ncbi:MAG: hypothetical protein ACT4N8_15940 [Sphingosinicella sp.]|uniref:hypothetical protein n=1 Tax=Sphingosinicella sp. TaxID=1917971 RepID=UPI004037BCFA
MPAELRDRRAWLAGGVILALLLVLYLTMRGEAPVAPPRPPPRSAPPPVAAAPEQAAAPTATPEGLKLHGITGAGAIIAMADGRQRLVAVGREVLPGLVLAENHPDHVVLRSGTSEFRLDFTGATTAGGTPASAPAQSGPASEAAIHAEALTYRLGLAPRRTGGRVTGHVVRAGARLPALERAGLQAGDAILRVNGSEFDQERMLELPWTIAQSERVTFEIERGGRPMHLSLERSGR